MTKSTIAFFTLVVVTLSCSQALGQSTCTLTAATAPSLAGLRLGMTGDELVALFPGSTKRREVKDALERAKSTTASETVYVQFDPSTDSAKGELAHVQMVSAGLYKGKVVDLTVMHADTSSSIDELIAKVSQRLKLPGASAWTAGPSENPSKVLICTDIEIEAAFLGGSSSVRIHSK